MPSIFSLFLCVSCLLFVSVLITCFFFLFTFCKHCMQKKCYDPYYAVNCITPLHFPLFPLFATNRASLQPTDRKFEKVFLDERHCVDEGFVASRPTWNLMERKLLWKMTVAYSNHLALRENSKLMMSCPKKD